MSDGFEEWYEYNERGEVSHYRDNQGPELKYLYEYYPNGKVKSKTVV